MMIKAKLKGKLRILRAQYPLPYALLLLIVGTVVSFFIGEWYFIDKANGQKHNDENVKTLSR